MIRVLGQRSGCLTNLMMGLTKLAQILSLAPEPLGLQEFVDDFDIRFVDEPEVNLHYEAVLD